MGFQINNKKGPISEINVTPFVDVMLVLLVIFMITAPLMLNGIKLNLPRTKEINPINLTANQVILSLTKSGDIYIGKQKILLKELLKEIQVEFKKTKTDTIFLRADFTLKYGNIARLMSYLKRGGVSKIALVTEVDAKTKL